MTLLRVAFIDGPWAQMSALVEAASDPDPRPRSIEVVAPARDRAFDWQPREYERGEYIHADDSSDGLPLYRWRPRPQRPRDPDDLSDWREA